jgi:hypothetical protein
MEVRLHENIRAGFAPLGRALAYLWASMAGLLALTGGLDLLGAIEGEPRPGSRDSGWVELAAIVLALSVGGLAAAAGAVRGRLGPAAWTGGVIATGLAAIGTVAYLLAASVS